MWPLPLPELLIALLRAGVDPDPARRPRSMGVVVRSLEPMLEGAAAVVLETDALATAHSLTSRARSPVMRWCEIVRKLRSRRLI